MVVETQAAPSTSGFEPEWLGSNPRTLPLCYFMVVSSNMASSVVAYWSYKGFVGNLHTNGVRTLYRKGLF